VAWNLYSLINTTILRYENFKVKATFVNVTVLYYVKQHDDHDKSILIFNSIATRQLLQIVKQNNMFGDATQTHQPVLDKELFCVLGMATLRISEFIIFTDIRVISCACISVNIANSSQFAYDSY
jgi:hypothetical protein